MQEGLTLIDLIFLIVVGVFVFTRFFQSKLPKDQNKTKKRPQARPLNVKIGATEDDFAQNTVVKLKPKDKTPLTGIDKLKSMDPFFREGKFLKGADNAFKMYFEALQEGDEEFLETFLSPKLMDEMRDVVDSKTKRAKVALVEKVNTSSIVNADVKGRTAFVDVMFDAKFDNDTSEKVIWTLARPVDSDDPNWDLDKIQKPS